VSGHVTDCDGRRIERQAKIATALRAAAEREPVPWRQRRLDDYALLIHVADSADEVVALLGEVERRLGVKVRRR
jgi:hypothetical protein